MGRLTAAANGCKVEINTRLFLSGHGSLSGDVHTARPQAAPRLYSDDRIRHRFNSHVGSARDLLVSVNGYALLGAA